jgi:CRISPR-associated protein Csm3
VTLAPGLVGKVIVKGELKVLTGIRIGASTSALEIGGIDNPVLRDPLTQRPYIPGSSLKGKLRSLLTKAHERPLRRLGRVQLHWCERAEEYAECMVCPTFGQFPSGPGGGDYSHFVTPARVCVRDCRLNDQVELDEPGGPRLVSWEDLEIGTDLPFTEVKTEVALDVVTAASNPRQMERVPPGAVFETEFLFSVYRSSDGRIDSQMEQRRLREVITAMRLLEDDYLGSSGTRGYGKVKFQSVRVRWRAIDFYRDPKTNPERALWQGDDLASLLEDYERQVAGNVWATS